MNPSHELAYLVVKALEHYQVDDIIISPGSRNAPLVNCLMQFQHFNFTSCIDERSAGFKALGISIASNKPAVLICTSGTAILNYAPAICEAYYQGVPLVVISADRPAAWIDQGDGQTIRQQNALGSYVAKCMQLNAPKSSEDFWLIKRQLGEVFCCPEFVNQKRPIHINCAFSEPLYGTNFKPQEQNPVFRDVINSKNGLTPSVIEHLAEKINAAQKVLWIVGQMDFNSGKTASQFLANIKQLPQCAILSETTSNVDAGINSACIDRNIVPIEQNFEDFQPEVLIHLGGPVVSKKIKHLLRKNTSKYTIRVHNTAFDEDTFKGLNLAINSEPSDFLLDISSALQANPNANYQNLWSNTIEEVTQYHNDFLSKPVPSDLFLFDCLHKNIPENTHIFWANSSPIRYAQLFEYKTKGLAHFANRGTSGIEGVTSTANGFALKSKQNTVLVSGDVSFLYDLNGLDEAPENFKVILINNQGGNIFRIIDGPDKLQNFEQFLETTHTKNAQHLAAHFQFNYQASVHFKDWEKDLNQFFAQPSKSILEVFTPRLENASVLKNYFSALIKAKAQNETLD